MKNSNVTQKLARKIMGENFFGIEEAMKYFEVEPTKEQMEALEEIPFTKKVLMDLKSTHILVAVFPISILDISKKADDLLPCPHDDGWCMFEFAENKGVIGWQLVRKTPVEDSKDETWDEQLKHLSKNDEVPSAQIMVYTIIGCYKNTGKKYFDNDVFVRTSSICSGDYVLVGDFFSWLSVHEDEFWDGRRHTRLGLSSVRKHNHF